MDNVSSYKRCGCRDPATGKTLGNDCPKLRRADGKTWSAKHGTWYGKTELAAGPGGERLTLRAGGFGTETDMEAWFRDARALLAIPDAGDEGHPARTEILALIKASKAAKGPLPDFAELQRLYQAGASFDPGTAGEYLLGWVETADLKFSTRASYRAHVKRMAKAFGHVPLGKLRTWHVQKFFDSIARRNQEIAAAKASGDPAARAGARLLRVTGPVTQRRIHATLRSALNDAKNGPEKLVAVNAAVGVRIAGGKSQKPREWTPERVAEWRGRYEEATTGLTSDHARFLVWKTATMRPSLVMFWTPEQTGRFLDHVAGDRLYAMWHVIIFRGPRRGEVCGLPWTEVNLDAGVFDVSTQRVQVGWTVTEETPKTEASDSPVSLDPVTVAVLRAHRKAQVAERLAMGPAWTDSGKVFTQENGQPLRPSWVSYRFQQLAFRAGCPPVREHDARRGAANLAHLAGATDKEIQELLRHESYEVSMNVYTSVFAAQSAALATRMIGLVPRSVPPVNSGRTAGPTTVTRAGRRAALEWF